MCKKLKWTVPGLNNISQPISRKLGFADCATGSGDAACDPGNIAATCAAVGTAATVSCTQGPGATGTCGGGGGGTCSFGGAGD